MTSSIERDSFNRRMLIKAASASTFALAAPRLSWGQSKTLVAATFPGTWSEADRQIILPAFKAQTGASVTQSIVLGTDQISRLLAAKGNNIGAAFQTATEGARKARVVLAVSNLGTADRVR